MTFGSGLFEDLFALLRGEGAFGGEALVVRLLAIASFDFFPEEPVEARDRSLELGVSGSFEGDRE